MTGPFQIGASGCGGSESHPLVAPTSCSRRPVAAGLVVSTTLPRKVWLEYACAEHVDHLIAPRLLEERDLAELARRQEQALRIEQKRPPYEMHQPIAVGVEAQDLVVRARRWAEANPIVLPGDGEQ